MVTLPAGFVKTKYPGYFWNVDDQVLYTIKGTGELRPMKKNPGYTGYNRFMRRFIDAPPGYIVSHKGFKHRLSEASLKKLVNTLNDNQVIGVQDGIR